jgi:hypothetical protein
MRMRDRYHECLETMTNAFRRLEARLQPPELVRHDDGVVFRYREKGIPQALIQKLARNISGLHAIDVLLLHGFVQEQAVLQRTLDEIHEDIVFLAVAITNDQITERHQQYLRAFYDDPLLRSGSHSERFQKPNLVPRKKIHAYVRRVLHKDAQASAGAEDVVSTAYSGYVHAASPYIMDMCVGDPPKFMVEGMRGTPRIAEHVEDAWNYFYRGLLSTCVVAKAFGDAELVASLYQYMAAFERKSGRAGYDRERSGA